MTIRPEAPKSEVAQFFASRDTNELAEWFEIGFRAIASGDVASSPFGFIRFEYPNAESISDILAQSYYEFRRHKPDIRDGNSFTIALSTAFKRLSVHSEIDRRAMIEVLRLFAKIGYSDVLGVIVNRLFPTTDSRDESLERLRSVALDVAIELSSRHPQPIPCLQSIVRSGLFRKEASRTIFLALCAEAPDRLMDHLNLLETSLGQVYSDSQPIDPEQIWRARCFFLYDLLEATSRNTAIRVIQVAIMNRQWPLSWLGDIPLETWRFNLLPEEISSELTELVSDIDKLEPLLHGDQYAIRTETQSYYPIEERQLNTNLLLSEDATKEEEDEVFRGLIRRLSFNQGTSPTKNPTMSHMITTMSHMIRRDSEFGGAA